MKAGVKIQETPAKVEGLEEVVSLGAGADHVLAAAANGRVWTWGCPDGGAFGPPWIKMVSGASKLVPWVLVEITKPARRIACGQNTSFIIDVDGGVWSRGTNSFAQATGRSSVQPLETPSRATSLEKQMVHEMAGREEHTLALTEEGRVLAWGKVCDGRTGLVVADLPDAPVVRSFRGVITACEMPTLVPGKSTAALGYDVHADRFQVWRTSSLFLQALTTA